MMRLKHWLAICPFELKGTRLVSSEDGVASQMYYIGGHGSCPRPRFVFFYSEIATQQKSCPWHHISTGTTPDSTFPGTIEA